MTKSPTVICQRKKEGRGRLLTSILTSTLLIATLVVYNEVFSITMYDAWKLVFDRTNIVSLLFSYGHVARVLLTPPLVIGVWLWKKTPAVAIPVLWAFDLAGSIMSEVMTYRHLSSLHLVSSASLYRHAVYGLIGLCWVTLWIAAVRRKWHLFA